MNDRKYSRDALRVLYSFPHRIGAGRICDTAFHQINGLAEAGARVTVLAASYARVPHRDVELWLTLAAGRVRIPVRWIGRDRACGWHDQLVAAWLGRHPFQYDVFHGWPLGSLASLRVASKLGIRSFLERPNAHTAHAYEVTRAECERLNIRLPHDHDHAFNRARLEREEMEYRAADYLLCPSDFVSNTFTMRGFSECQLIRHHYGFDDGRFFPVEPIIQREHEASSGIVALFAGSGEPRKGLHFALQAWQRAGVGRSGRFVICSNLIPAYRDALSPWLQQPGVELIGPTDSPEQAMRQADVLILPSLEEGSALVTYEAIGSGCVPLVSDCTGAMCNHKVDSLIHPAGDIDTLAGHITMLDADRAMLAQLRSNGLQRREQLTWKAAGRRLLHAYTSASNAAV